MEYLEIKKVIFEIYCWMIILLVDGILLNRELLSWKMELQFILGGEKGYGEKC